MKNISIGIALCLYPSYVFFAWLYVFNRFRSESQQTKVVKFRELIFYSDADTTYLLLICVILSFFSIYFFAKSFKINFGITKVLALALTIYATVLTVLLFGYMM